MAKTPYDIYDMHKSEALSDILYSQIVEKGVKFDVSMFQNSDLAKDLCDTSLKPSNLSQAKARKLLKMVSWLVDSRNNAQLSIE